MCKRIFRIIFSILFSLSTVAVFSANYYAAPSANGVGTLSDPCSISTGFLMLSNPGDTLFLRGGVYSFDAKQSMSKLGTADARIGIMAYQDETPILDFSTQPYGSSFPGISLHAASAYMHIRGLTIRYAGDNGMINNGNNHIIENCSFYGNCDTGLQHKSGGGNLIKNCDSYSNFDYQTGGVLAADFGGNADGFADKQYTNAVANTYEGCRAWNNADDGWDFFQKVGSSILKNCICYQNGPKTYNLVNSPRLSTDAVWFSQFPKTVTNSDAGTDGVSLENYPNYGNGNGFKLGGEYTRHNITLTNCLSVGHKKLAGVAGFSQNNNAGAMTLYNCAAFDNYYNYVFLKTTAIDGVHKAALTIKNSASLLAVTGSNSFSADTLVNINNTWNSATSVSCTVSDYVSVDSTVIISPRQADGSLPKIVFMQLADGSDLIDKGLDVGLAFAGTAPDLGCFEKNNLLDYPAAVTCPSNRNQGIPLGTAIENIVLKWSAGATRLSVSGLPLGVDTVINTTAKTLTISGTPIQEGAFFYTVSTVGGLGLPATVSGTIRVAASSAKKIAYYTSLSSEADSLILNKLNANPNFIVTCIDASIGTFYTNYDLVVVSPVPHLGSYGVPYIELANKPRLLLKPSAMGVSRWDWATSASTTSTKVSVSNKSHEIFKNLSFTGVNNDELDLFSQNARYAVNGISAFVGTPALNLLANAIGTDTMAIVEIPVGTSMNGTTVNSRFLMMGMSEYSLPYLTANAIQLIENSCYYLLGMDVPLNVNEKEKTPDYHLIQTKDEIKVQVASSIVGLELINISGQTVLSTKENYISVSNIDAGIYVLRIKTAQFDTYTKVFVP